jgi:hypothetical protein
MGCSKEERMPIDKLKCDRKHCPSWIPDNPEPVESPGEKAWSDEVDQAHAAAEKQEEAESDRAERDSRILQRWPEVEKYLRRKIISLQKVQTELESTGRELELAELRKLLGDKQ